MEISKRLSKSFKEVYFGKNWTSSSLQEQLEGVPWKLANATLGNHNTIGALTYHLHYYVRTISKVLQNGPLEGNDKHSWESYAISNDKEWSSFKNELFIEAETFIDLIEKIPESTLEDHFTDVKYGDYYRNILGVIEHTHYHLGQISILKKVLSQ